MASGNHFDAGELMGHVKDSTSFHVPQALGGHIDIPQVRDVSQPIHVLHTGFGPLDELLEPLELQITKFMVLEVVAAVIIMVLFVRLAQKIAGGQPVKGRFWNLLEAMVLFIRDEVARPAIGKHDADRFMPFLWTLFFFVLGCNLLGMIPWAGSPTGAIAVTGALALCTFCTVIGCGMAKLGVVGFWKAQVPHMDLPLVLAVFLKPMIFAIELLGLLIKHFVLSVRLLANMMAGHIVLSVLIAFIGAAAAGATVWGVMPTTLTGWGVSIASILGCTALSLLELFVAFLQAYIFVFLSSLFIGMAVHPH